jgi:hypothetical protein
MVVWRLTTILPAITLAEAIDTTCNHSVAGLPSDRTALVTTRPFSAPHYTIPDAGLIGGGHMPMPGEVLLAHNGVLFLNELPEFSRHVLESLRQPLEGSAIYLQSRRRFESQRCCRLSALSNVREGFGDSPVATHHLNSPNARCVSLPPPLKGRELARAFRYGYIRDERNPLFYLFG